MILYQLGRIALHTTHDTPTFHWKSGIKPPSHNGRFGFTNNTAGCYFEQLLYKSCYLSDAVLSHETFRA